MSIPTDQHELRDIIRDRYAAAATVATGENPSAAACCSADGAIVTEEQRADFGASLYDDGERDELPASAVLASLGCGNPIAIAELHEGETVLDLGSGGGIDVLLSARRVGATGLAYGLDMTDEMLDLARRNQAEAGLSNVQWLRGHIEDIPLPRDSVDVIISNCVINLSADKPQVLREAAREDRGVDREVYDGVIGVGVAKTRCILGRMTIADLQRQGIFTFIRKKRDRVVQDQFIKRSNLLSAAVIKDGFFERYLDGYLHLRFLLDQRGGLIKNVGAAAADIAIRKGCCAGPVQTPVSDDVIG